MTKKSKVKQHVENPLEAILNSFSGNVTEHASEKRKKGKRAGELFPGQELNFKDLQENDKAQEEEKTPNIEAGIDYSNEIVHVEEIAIKRENRDVEMQLREIMVEIKKLADSSKELQAQFRGVAVEQYTTTPGKYHKNFFSWLLSVIRAARMKVEDSGAWLQAMHSKKKSREYGAMAKKQGTSFTLNNERNVATQVG
jgi:hypothetical protein